MNKLLNYGFGTLIGFSMILPACTEKKSAYNETNPSSTEDQTIHMVENTDGSIINIAEEKSTWSSLIDENLDMTQKQKDAFKQLVESCDSIFITNGSCTERTSLIISDSTVTGPLTKGRDTVGYLTFRKAELAFNQESQKENGIVGKFEIDKKINCRLGRIVAQDIINTHADGTTTRIKKSIFKSFE